MRPSKIIAAILATSLLVACSDSIFYTPLPADKMQYAGEWKGEGVALLIEPKGRFVYVRVSDKARTSVDSPIKEFKGDNIVVGLGPLASEFTVSNPPHEDDGVWKMTFNGVELVRSPTTTY